MKRKELTEILSAILTEIAQAAFTGESESVGNKDRGRVFPFHRAGLDWQPWKTRHVGRTNISVSSAINLLAATETITPDCAEPKPGDRVERFSGGNSKGDLSRHSNWPSTHQRKIYQSPYEHRCRYCSFSSGDACDVAAHEWTHKKEKPFRCSMCDSTFTQKSSLAYHERLHTGERPFKCQTCGRAFISRRDLVRHERVHTGEKPFKCDSCPRAFSDKSNLIAHQRRHQM
ncbi:unnamed protein product [Ixodes persulcatus]